VRLAARAQSPYDECGVPRLDALPSEASLAWRLDCLPGRLLACLCLHPAGILLPLLPLLDLPPSSTSPIPHGSFPSVPSYLPVSHSPSRPIFTPQALPSPLDLPQALSTTPAASIADYVPPYTRCLRCLVLGRLDSPRLGQQFGPVSQSTLPLGRSFLPFIWTRPRPRPHLTPPPRRHTAIPAHLQPALDRGPLYLNTRRRQHHHHHHLLPTRHLRSASTHNLVPLHPQLWFAPARAQSRALFCKLDPHLITRPQPTQSSCHSEKPVERATRPLGIVADILRR
jgi:hypothetical protein